MKNVASEAIVPAGIPSKNLPVYLMLTCLCDAFYPKVGLATVECLETLGYEVIFPEDQTCCGQPAFNSGDRNAARAVARHTLKVFQDAEQVLTPSGSCAAMIRWGFPQLFQDEKDQQAFQEFGSRTWELSEFLLQTPHSLPWPGRYPKKIAIHRACHLRELTPEAGPEPILRSIQDTELVDINFPEQCCGFGGTFAVTFPWISGQIGKVKLEDLTTSGAEEIVSSDMSCLMHLQGLQDKSTQESNQPSHLRFRHFSEVLQDSLRSSGTTEP